MANRQKTYRLDGPVRVLLGCNYKELIMLFFGAVGGYLSVSKFTENAENAVAAISLMIFAILGGLGLAYSLILGLRFLYERMPDKFVSHLRSWYTQPDVYLPTPDQLAKPIEIRFDDLEPER